MTLLMLAARDGKTRALNALLDAGAEVDAVNGVELDARHFAAAGAHREAALALDRRGSRATWARAPELASWLAEPHRHLPLSGPSPRSTVRRRHRGDGTAGLAHARRQDRQRVAYRVAFRRTAAFRASSARVAAVSELQERDAALRAGRLRGFAAPLSGLPERGLWQLFACLAAKADDRASTALGGRRTFSAHPPPTRSWCGPRPPRGLGANRVRAISQRPVGQ